MHICSQFLYHIFIAPIATALTALILRQFRKHFNVPVHHTGKFTVFWCSKLLFKLKIRYDCNFLKFACCLRIRQMCCSWLEFWPAFCSSWAWIKEILVILPVCWSQWLLRTLNKRHASSGCTDLCDTSA